MVTQNEPRSIEEIRSEARRLLQTRVSSSLRTSGKIFLAVVPSLAEVGGALIALDLFNYQWFIILIALSCFVFLIAFLTAEWSRLISHSEKLKELIAAERSYEILIGKANDERDKARSDLERLIATHQITLAAQDVFAKLKTIIPPKEDDSTATD